MGAFSVERLNDYAHLQELKTANYGEWGLFAEEDAYLLRASLAHEGIA